MEVFVAKRGIAVSLSPVESVLLFLKRGELSFVPIQTGVVAFSVLELQYTAYMH